MSERNSENKSQIKAVVVNDDVTQLNIISGLLQKAGVEPIPFRDAADALTSLRHDLIPALIVTDLYMPGIDGWRFCRLLRSPDFEKFNETPILVVSATFSGEEPTRISSELGANAFLSMPLDGKNFVNLVHSLLSGENAQVQPRVLVVEDILLFPERLVRVFQAHGYQTDSAGTCQEALSKIEQENYDIAILDYHLPDGKGDDLLMEIHTKFPDCICVMMTADNRPELAVQWLKAGAATYIRKPFEPEYLIAECERALRERALLRIQETLEMRTQQLRQSEERFRGLVEYSENLIFSVDRQGRFLTAGGNRLKEFGLRPKDLVNKTLFDLFPKKDADRYQKKHLEVFASNQPITYEQNFEFAGVTKIDLTTLYPIRNESGEVESIGVVCHDITVEKKLQTALQESQALYQDLIETQTDLVCRWLPDTTLTYVNQAYCDYFKRSREELLGSRFISWLPEETGNVIRSTVESLSSGEIVSLRRDEMNVGSQEAARWVQWVYRTIRNENGKVVEIQSVGRDITGQKLVEQSLKIQHSLSAQLNIVKDITEAMRLILSACLQFENIDSGGAYVLDQNSGCLKLIDHHGLSADFIASCSMYPFDAPEVRLARKGQIIYGDYKDIRLKEDSPNCAEGLQALAVLPFLVGGELLAILNLASHTWMEFSDPVRFTLETMQEQLSSVLERIQIEMKLRESRDEFKLILTSQQDLMIKTDTHGRLLFVNPAYSAMFGKTEEELLGTSYTPQVHPDDLQIVEKAVTQLFAPPFSCAYEERAWTANGWRWLSWAVKSVRDGQGNVIALISSGRDITDRKLAEEKLLNEAIRQNILMEQSKDGIVILDQNGKVYESNRKFADMLGYPSESMRNLSVFDWEFMHTRERTIEMLNSVDETGDHFESKHRRRDGSIYDVEISSNSAWFDGQKLIFCVCRDITERKRIEQELSLKSLVLDQIYDHVTITDLQGNITYVNDAETKTMGIPREQLIGMSTNIYGEDAEKGATQKEIVDNTLRNGFWRCEVVNYAHDGSEHYMDCRTQVVQGADGKPIALCGIATDVTERKLMEQSLYESENKYRLIAENTSDGIIIFNEKNQVLFVSPSYVSQLGYSEHEELSRTPEGIALLIHPEERDEIINNIFLAIRSKKSDLSYSYRALHSAGYYIWREDNTRFIYDTKGNHIRSYVVSRDITKRKRQEDVIVNQLNELRRWHKITLGRENRIMELKREINRMLMESGKPVRFSSVKEDPCE